jgi:hypothetical protein
VDTATEADNNGANSQLGEQVETAGGDTGTAETGASGAQGDTKETPAPGASPTN